MSMVNSPPAPTSMEPELRNRFRDSVYREQGKRGLGPYGEAHEHGNIPGHNAEFFRSGAELKRTRNLFEERVRYYLGRGSFAKGHLNSMSQAGLATVRRRTSAGVSAKLCAECKRVMVSLAGIVLVLTVSTIIICIAGSIWGVTPTLRTLVCIGTAVLLMAPLVTIVYFIRKYTMTTQLRWNEQHNFMSDLKICGVVTLLAAVSGSFTSIYGRHLYLFANHDVVDASLLSQLPNQTALGDAFNSTVFQFNASNMGVTHGVSTCEATAIDVMRYNISSWTVFPYLEDCVTQDCGNFAVNDSYQPDVSYWFTYGTKLDQWFVSDLITEVPTSGIFYGMPISYSEHDGTVLQQAVWNSAALCNLTASPDAVVLTLISSVDALVNDWWTALVVLLFASGVLLPSLVYTVYIVLKKCCSTTTVVILKD